MQFLHTNGKYIENEKNERVYLRGTAIGGWLMMEAFMTGYLGTESQLRRSIKTELGEERYDAFFKGYLDNFITEEDFQYLASLGMNVVRIAVNGRHLEDDSNPFVYKKDGFKYLDRAVAWGKKYGIYTIIDLHALPGWQNNRWHCDNEHGLALIWKNPIYQERAVKLWGHIAEHYKDEPAVAAFDLMNEPEAPEAWDLYELYNKLIVEIRRVGSRQILFVEGNDRGKDFKYLDKLMGENIAYSSHNYNSVNLDAREYPGWVGENYADANYMKDLFLYRNKWMLDRDVVSYCGEFSVMYMHPADKPSYAELARTRALKDQLQVYADYDQQWTIWCYKDIFYTGMVVPNENCEYMRRIWPVVELKNRLGIDRFTARTYGEIPKLTQGLLHTVAAWSGELIHDYSLPYPTMLKRVGEEAIACSLSGFMAPLYANRFADMTADEIYDMMEKAFNIKYMKKRPCLEAVLKESLQQG